MPRRNQELLRLRQTTFKIELNTRQSSVACSPIILEGGSFIIKFIRALKYTSYNTLVRETVTISIKRGEIAVY